MSERGLQMDPVLARLSAVKDLNAAIHARLLAETEGLGYDVGRTLLQPPTDAIYRLDRDPYSGDETLVGEWRDDRGMKRGELLFHADGSFMVEQDIAQAHPSRSDRFVEAVCAWGRDGEIKCEARLLPMPG